MLRLKPEGAAGSSDVLCCTSGDTGLVTGQVAEVDGDCVEEEKINDDKFIIVHSSNYIIILIYSECKNLHLLHIHVQYLRVRYLLLNFKTSS